MIHEHLSACDSTQDEVRARLDSAERHAVVAVSADSQHAGRGRDGRTWHDPPGVALLVSVGRRGPLPVTVLEDLPRRVADALSRLFAAEDHVLWKPPNDLVDEQGAKVAGILIDARTVGDWVEYVIVGVGINAAGAPFTTADGRAATTLGALGIDAPPVTRVAEWVAEQLS